MIEGKCVCGWIKDAHSETCKFGKDGKRRCIACRIPVSFWKWLTDGRCQACQDWNK